LGQQSVKTPAGVANAVYKNLLQSEKQKAYESIKSIQTEIADLQGKYFQARWPTTLLAVSLKQCLMFYFLQTTNLTSTDRMKKKES